ncbi:hypothetical protein LSTR_LSTR005866 [Laodelphax striatellus]|uniref:Uncharacterized protein n=1 Tax=Laodelphax striatellus TaxID=195883 RepID=A0A482WSQ4_LAOST|nr:hypothetical protein LSTR_LSTR005866 [Laodelphax striatellus]
MVSVAEGVAQLSSTGRLARQSVAATSLPDFRLKTYRNCNWLLEAYYKFGEELSAENKVIRINDLETWKANGEI